jgi:uncharacterized protein (TIGR03083 family)
MTTTDPERSPDAALERAAYRHAAGWFRDVVSQVEHWDDPGLGEWTVRDLVGHASRSLVTVETYLDAEPGEVTLRSSVAYYEAVLAGLASGTAGSPEEVAERGRAAGRALGTDAGAFLADLDARTQSKVASAPDDAFVGTPFGGIRLVDYLPTRTFELVVHTGDLAQATGLTSSAPDDALTSALRLVADLSRVRGHGLLVLHALTGRRPLPHGFSLL